MLSGRCQSHHYLIVHSRAVPALSRSVAIFDAIAPLAVLFPADAAVIDEAAQFLASMCNTPHGTLLDFGCGLGQIVDALTRRGLRAVGYEPSAGMRSQAARLARAEHAAR